MNDSRRYWILGLISLLSFNSCDLIKSTTPGEEENFTKVVNNKDQKGEETSDSAKAESAVVKTIPSKPISFPLQTQTSGLLQAQRQTEIKTRTSGRLLSLPIQEGQYLQAHTLIAQLDNEALKIQMTERQLELEKALYEKNDLLMLGGGTSGIDTSVSKGALENILIQSGYTRAQHNIKKVEYELRQKQIYAPFAGIVADLQLKQHQEVNAGEILCRLIDPNSFEVEFNLLEKEALRIKKGQVVKVSPIALPNKIMSAKVTTINPVVNEQGLVTFRAKVNGASQLYEGMNMRVSIEISIPNQLVIPKEAVVLRSGRQVVFVYDEASGLAKWHYVTVAYENETSVAISEGLETGDLVIYEGNANLAHDAEVEVEGR